MQGVRAVAAVLVGVCCGAAQSIAAQDVSLAQHEQRAQQYLRERKPELARKELEIVAAAEPGNLDAQANLGVLLYFAGDVRGAEPHLRAAVAINPQLGKVQALLGFCEHRNGELAEARKDLSAALPNLDDAKVRKQAGLELVELDTGAGDLQAAAAVMERLKLAAPTDPEILYAAYRVNSDLAGESLLELSLAAPKSAQMQQAIAHELERVRDVSGAIASFRRAIAIDSNLPGIHLELAEALRSSDSQQDKAAAEGEYVLALKQNPAEAHAAVRLGDIHADRNDAGGAAGFYEQALKVQPGMAEASIGLAQVESTRGENEKALALLQGVIAADPSNMLAHFRLSALYRKMHRPEEAKRELAEYQKIRDLKESLRQTYSTMKLQAPGAAAADAGGDAKSGVKQ